MSSTPASGESIHDDYIPKHYNLVAGCGSKTKKHLAVAKL